MNDIKKITVPCTEEITLEAGDMVELTGTIYCGRDAVLPHVMEMADKGVLAEYDVDLRGAVIFHTAVSVAGIAPTTSSKPEIEGSIVPLSKHGARFHLGKGMISQETVEGLAANHSYFLVTPPVAALLTATMSEKKAVIHPEFGIEAFWKIEVKNFPAIVAVANGRTIFAGTGV